MKLLIADDHGMFRLGLKVKLEQQMPDLQVLEAESGEQVLDILGKQRGSVDLILLDLNMPGNTGLSLFMQIQTKHPEQKVCFISGTEDMDVAAKIMDAGAKGFIPKASANELVLTAIQLIASGGSYWPDNMHNQNRQKNRNLTVNLTQRQIEVLQKAADGLSNKQIAADLFISEGTVKSHMTTIFDELGVKNRTQAINKGRDLGIVI